MATLNYKHLNRVYSPNRPTFEYYSRSWEYFTESMQILKERGANFITMSDAYAGRYNDNGVNIILDHHIDYYPVETEVLARWEKQNGVISSIYLFNHSHYCLDNSTRGQEHKWDIEDLNIPFYQELEKLGFEIGYHNNSVGQAQSLIGRYSDRNIDKLEPDVFELASEIFEHDVTNLSRYFNIRTFIPHGDGENNNKLFPLPDNCMQLIWAYNNHRMYNDPEIIPKWRNFSDSNLDLPQAFRISGGNLVCSVDNLKLFCASVDVGLHHLVLHPGRYAAGMPYDMYLGPIPISDNQITTNNKFNIENLKAPVDAYIAQNNEETGAQKEIVDIHIKYCLTDCATHLENTMLTDRFVIGLFLAGEKLSIEEKLELKIDRNDMSGGFRMPCGKHDFLEDYSSFINKIYTKNSLATFAELSIPLSNVFLREIAARRFVDVHNIIKIIKNVEAQNGSFDMTVIIGKDIYKKFMTLLQNELGSLYPHGGEIKLVDAVREPDMVSLNISNSSS